MSRLSFDPVAVEAMIRSGRDSEARQALRERFAARVPRPLAARFAELCWRAGLPELGLRALRRLVYPSGRFPRAPTDDQKLEYAACLAKVGASREALEVLDGVNGPDPKRLFYRAMVLVAQWRYRESIPVLQDYLRCDLAEYQRVVARINLAAAYVVERRSAEAGPLLRELERACSGNEHRLALAKVYELSAESAINDSDFRAARGFLAKAQELLERSEGIDSFMVRKWAAIVDFLESPDRPGSRERLSRFKREAFDRGHWESFRDCDRYLAHGLGDTSRLLRLLFGTPYPEFRERLLDQHGRSVSLPDTYDWSPPRGECSRLIDLSGESLHVGPHSLGPDQLLLRLFKALARDFFRPQSLGELHQCLYPGTPYNPLSSPAKVHNLIARLRRWFEEAGLSLSVDEVRGRYRLRFLRPLTVRVARTGFQSRREVSAARLRERCADQAFSLREAAGLLGMSPRNALRELSPLLESAELVKEGSGPRTRYRFTVPLSRTG